MLKRNNDSSNNVSNRRDSSLMEELKDALITGGDTHYLLENIDTTLDLTRQNRFKSAINLPTYLKENEKVMYGTPVEVFSFTSTSPFFSEAFQVIRIFSVDLEII